MIDLTKYKKPIREFIVSTVQSFAKQYPGTKVSCIGLYSSPLNGWISVGFDTLAHSDENVTKFKDRGPEWYGKDERGQYCNNCPDFEFASFGMVDFEEWAEEYQSSEVVKIKYDLLRTKKIYVEQEGDEALNKVFFTYFIKIIKDAEKQVGFSDINRENPFRIGVQMLDSEYSQFWVSK